MNILALSPHTDDVELGAGGTLARFIEEGHNVMVAAFGTGDTRGGANEAEHLSALAALGVTDSHLFDRFPAHCYPSCRQEILECLEGLRNKLLPDLVLCPSLKDSHQDHATVAMETIRVFKYCASILAYETAWNYVAEPFKPTCFVRLDERHMQAKMGALKCYASQSKRTYWNMDFIQGQALVHGMRIRARYAEAFEVLRETR